MLNKDHKNKIRRFIRDEVETPADETPGESMKKLLELSDEDYKIMADEIEEFEIKVITGEE